MKYKQVIILGHGRSGTNWLCRALDYSSNTHCRNESNRFEGNPLNKLPNLWVVGKNNNLLEKNWQNAVRWNHEHFGERDRIIEIDKIYLRSLSKTLGLYRLFAGGGSRKLLSMVSPQFGLPEYTMPGIVVDKKKLSESLLVLKINQAPELGEWVLRNCNEVSVIQIVRHPGGVLNSWKNRYLSGKNYEHVLESNLRRLEMISDEDKKWADAFGNIRSMELEESELWFWRYSNEMIHLAGKNNNAYLLCLYEDLAERPFQVLKGIYDHVGLEWNQKIENHVKRESHDSTQIAEKWRNSLNGSEVNILEKIMDGSIMQHWWDK